MSVTVMLNGNMIFATHCLTASQLPLPYGYAVSVACVRPVCSRMSDVSTRESEAPACRVQPPVQPLAAPGQHTPPVPTAWHANPLGHWCIVGSQGSTQ